MKIPATLLVLLLFAVDAAAQTPAGGASAGPQQIAQGGASAPAGSAAVGATIPAANTGGASATAAAIGLTVAAFAAAAFGYNTTNTASNH
jgi:hypothetical protein